MTAVRPELLTELADELRAIADRLAPPPRDRAASASELRTLRTALDHAGFREKATRQAAVASMMGRTIEHPNELKSADVARLLTILGGSE